MAGLVLVLALRRLLEAPLRSSLVAVFIGDELVGEVDVASGVLAEPVIDSRVRRFLDRAVVVVAGALWIRNARPRSHMSSDLVAGDGSLQRVGEAVDIGRRDGGRGVAEEPHG